METIHKLSKLFMPEEKWKGFRVLLLVLGMALLDTAGLASMMPFLAVVGDPDIIQQNVYISSVFDTSRLYGISTKNQFLVLLGTCSFLLLLLSAFYRVITEYKMNSFVEQLRHSISSRLLKVYLAQPYEFFMKRNTSEMSKSTLSEVDQLIGTVLRPVFNMFAYAIVAICITLFLLYLYPLLLLCSILVLGGAYAVTFAIIRKRLDNLGRLRSASNKNRFWIAQEALSGIRELKLLGAERYYTNKFDGESLKLSHSLAMNLTLGRVPKYIIEALAFGGIIILVLSLIIAEGGVESEALGRILPLVGVFTFAAYRLQPSLHFIFSGIASIRFGRSAVEKIYEDIILYQPLASDFVSTNTVLKFENNLTLTNLTFRYQGTTRNILDKVNLEITAGNVIGVVGSTGCGKSTLVNLIANLLTPTSGSITVDGLELSAELSPQWQKAIGYVPQNIFLTDASIAENIALGQALSSIDHDRVIECAKLASIHDFVINDLPQKYLTIVGERGVRLSGGQRQRIGIARALYNAPHLLIFDEATSALDNIVEKEIMNAIDNLSENHTIILIAHRINTIKKCDTILLMHDGKIDARGNYEELIKHSARFKELCEAANR